MPRPSPAFADRDRREVLTRARYIATHAYAVSVRRAARLDTDQLLYRRLDPWPYDAVFHVALIHRFIGSRVTVDKRGAVLIRTSAGAS